MRLIFSPTGRIDLPSLAIIGPDPKGEYKFAGYDLKGEVQFESFHTNLPDALEQVARRMRADGTSRYGII